MKFYKLLTYCRLSRYAFLGKARKYCNEAAIHEFPVVAPDLETPQVYNANDNNTEPVNSLLGDGFNYHNARLFRLKKRKLWKEQHGESKPPKNTSESKLPICLTYILKDNNEELKENYPDIFDKDYTGPDVVPEIVSFPFSHQKSLFSECNESSAKSSDEIYDSDAIMKDYVANYLKLIDEDVANMDSYNVGRPDVPSSGIPCSGCGSVLHCRDVSIPGFMPSVKFLSLSSEGLRKEICYRCFFLKHYNTAMDINISPEEYPQAIAEIKKKRALVVLMVDLMDFPCSIWPGIIDLIGETRPICVVGNKVDLLPRDSRGYLNNVKKSLAESLKKFGVDRGNNIKHVNLISAKTGYGVEELITKLQMAWKYKGDIYLIGCTNVGKSSLFNTLLRSDLCKKQASDIVPRATTSIWPGTTINLLRFPLFRMNDYQVYERTKRLISTQKESAAERRMRFRELTSTKDQTYATLFGNVQQTHKDENTNSKTEDGFFSPGFAPSLPKAYDPDDPAYKLGKFCYDTPGSMYKEQILDLLTTDELMKVLPKQIITPRTFQVREAQTLFVAGLARIDVLKGGKHVYLTVFSSNQLPVHLVDTVNADLFYEQNIGTPMIMVPQGGQKRLAEFPKLQGKSFSMTGLNWKESCADIVLSSTGWVSVTGNVDVDIEVNAYTPECRGIHLRQPALLPFAINLKGYRIKGVPSFDNKWASVL